MTGAVHDVTEPYRLYLTKDRDQLQSSYNNLTKDRDQLQTSYNNLTKDRDQLQTSYNNLTKDRDQLREDRDRYLRTFCSKQKCFSFSSSFYVISNETKNWEESRKDCKVIGADLVIINSKEEQEFIIKQLNNPETWIGLSDTVNEGEWKWVDDTPLNTGSWARGEPNNAGEEDCAVIYTYPSHLTATWNDQKCSANFPWICKQKCFSFSSSFYIMSNETKSWEESRKDCKAKGADLVIIKSKEEQGSPTQHSEYLT
ncbi:CD209 antigen-like protein E [Tachysurus vachellii]|uniref:CD209 antigen-like protein E n=1 Tax=Tachysurus vachellii TaxID=175792 RepID=UPI00296AC2D6|nr:CD209 antigen-like protein E [Tachysurus vachellii]